MTRKFPAFLLGLAVLVGPAWAVGRPAESGEFSSVTTIVNGKAKRVTQTKVCWQGTSYRSEVRRGSEAMVVLRGPSGDTYIYLPDRKAASRMPRGKGEKLASVTSSMAGESRTIAKKGKKIGAGKVSGFLCDVYELKEQMGPHTISGKRWISRDPRLPIVMKSVSTLQGGSRTSEITSVRLGGKYPASLFELPKGTKIMTMPSNPHKGMAMPAPGTKAPQKSAGPKTLPLKAAHPRK